jgi:hypothetical protein
MFHSLTEPSQDALATIGCVGLNAISDNGASCPPKISSTCVSAIHAVHLVMCVAIRQCTQLLLACAPGNIGKHDNWHCKALLHTVP